jgi:hypothetical protein
MLNITFIHKLYVIQYIILLTSSDLLKDSTPDQNKIFRKGWGECRYGLDIHVSDKLETRNDSYPTFVIMINQLRFEH